MWHCLQYLKLNVQCSHLEGDVAAHSGLSASVFTSLRINFWYTISSEGICVHTSWLSWYSVSWEYICIHCVKLTNSDDITLNLLPNFHSSSTVMQKGQIDWVFYFCKDKKLTEIKIPCYWVSQTNSVPTFFSTDRNIPAIVRADTVKQHQYYKWNT